MSQQVSDLGLELHPEHRHRRRRAFGCLAVLLSLAVLVGGGFFAYSFGLNALKDMFRPPADYAGRGSGTVLVEVKQGDAAVDIGRTLVSKRVVRSTEAFTDAARSDPRSVGIQVGFYQMRRQMSAESALAVLLDPANLMRDVVTVPEGLRVDQIVDLLVRKTDFSKARFDKVLARPRQLGLPPYAAGNAEGYLFPATYELPPDATPRTILASMVDRYKAAAGDLRLAAGAKRLGFTSRDVMTVASMVQAEGRIHEDLPKIARVIYNRLDRDRPLQLDATVTYIFKSSGKVTTTRRQRAVDSPYNTYRVTGLPPTPISAPGEAAIKAALEPAKGSWLYFVTTDLEDGAMSFATTYADHMKNVARFRAYCRTHDC